MAPTATPTSDDHLPGDATEARQRLADGNRAMAQASPDPGRVPAQQPFAIVFSCSDARVPTEAVFSAGPNELFVIRAAGNVVGSEGLGSLHYAVSNLAESLKLVVVLGHAGCGAVSTAVDAYLDPSAYLGMAPTHALRTVVDRLFLPVRLAARALVKEWSYQTTGRAGYRDALLHVAVALNAALTAKSLIRQIELIPGAEPDAVFGVYDLASYRVGVDGLGEGSSTVLADPPDDARALGELARCLATGPRARALLAGRS